MRTKHLFTLTKRAALLVLLSTLNLQPSTVFAQGSAFTYQGRLFDNGAPANGDYNLRLTLYDDSTLGNVVGLGPLISAPVAVSNGLFTVLLDFGPAAFTGSPVWLQMEVSSNTIIPLYVSLSTRQQLTPAPYAIYSENSGAANSVNANGVSAEGLNTLGAPFSGQVLSYDGSSLIWTTPSAGGGGDGWSLTGNDGSGAFLGTTNNYPLRLFANNLGAAMFWPYANGNVSVALGTYSSFSVLGNGGDFIAAGGYSGAPNVIYTDYSSIGGGFDNRINASSPESVIAGGNGHRITGGSGTIGGGGYNTISNASVGTIPGGGNNLVSGDYGFAAGNSAQALHPGAFVWADNSGGSFASTSNNQFSVRANGGVRFVTGGAGVTIDGAPLSGGGGGGSGWSLTGNDGSGAFLGTTNNYPLRLFANNVGAATFWPYANGNVSVALGTYSSFSVLGNGGDFIAAGGYSGAPNVIYTDYSSIGGGYDNRINLFSPESVIAGGSGHRITGGSGTIGGGGYNTISNASVGTIPGGGNNLVSGDYGFAAGHSAQALHPGAFVWADNTGSSFASTSNNQFSVRANGGVRFETGGAGMTIDGVLVTNGGGGLGGSGWGLHGNSGTSPDEDNYLGTTDNEPLELHVYGSRALRLEPGFGYPNIIGGWFGNTVSGSVGGATIGGGGAVGSPNSVSAFFGTIGGGYANTNSGQYGTVGGGSLNAVTSGDATVSGGSGNTASGAGATVPGGYSNTAGGATSFAAGQQAKAMHQGAFVWADSQNAPFPSTLSDQFSVRAAGGVRFETGGAGVAIDGVLVTNGGGGGSGGSGWSLTGNSATPANFLGTTNDQALDLRVNNTRAFRLEPGSGFNNLPNVIGGSSANSVAANHFAAAIGGGSLNTISANYATVSGGSRNTNSGDYATVGGGIANTASGPGSFVGGGGYDGTSAGGNIASGNAATVGGGLGNQAIGNYSSVPGGFGNTNSGDYATVGGGAGNQASNTLATVAGGAYNIAGGPGSFVGGGGYDGTTYSGNVANGNAATVAGGLGNHASGNYSTVLGGYQNYADGAYSFAGGHNAVAHYDGSFVWSGSTGGLDDSAPNMFRVRAPGGVDMFTGTGSGMAMTLDEAGGTAVLQAGLNASLVLNNDGLSLLQSGEETLTLGAGHTGIQTGIGFGVLLSDGAGTASSQLTVRTSRSGTTENTANFYAPNIGVNQSYIHYGTTGDWYIRSASSSGKVILEDTGGKVGIGTASPSQALHVIGNILASGTITGSSDRNVKENFAPINPRDVLDKVAALPITRWNYKADTDETHLGPMAQDFYAAFTLGMDDKHISMVDADGVALAAIQGLNQKVEEQRNQLEQKQTEITELKQRLERLEQLMAQRIGGAK